MNTSKSNISLQSILKNRTQQFGSFCSLKEKPAELSLPCQTQPVVDERLMSARAIINTPREDREGDVIVPRGVQLENYRKNPVVLWEHGLGEITRPIAKCQLPNGELALEVEDESISAISFFTDKCLESLQIFHLIAEGLVRATSVRALPIKSAVRKTSEAKVGIMLEKWELIEWSWGALGVNPDAVARTIDRGTIEGRKITEPLLKSLKATLAPEGFSIPGWTPAEPNETEYNSDFPRSAQNEKTTAAKPADSKTITANHNNDPATEMPFASAGTEDGNKPESNALLCSDRTSPPAGPIPLGAQILKSILDTISAFKQRVIATQIILENEPVKQHLKSFLQALENEQYDLEQLFEENYEHLTQNMQQPAPDTNSVLQEISDFDLTRSWKALNLPLAPSPQDDHGLTESESKFNSLQISQHQMISEILKHLQQNSSGPPDHHPKNLEQEIEGLTRSIQILHQKFSDLFPVR